MTSFFHTGAILINDIPRRVRTLLDLLRLSELFTVGLHFSTHVRYYSNNNILIITPEQFHWRFSRSVGWFLFFNCKSSEKSNISFLRSNLNILAVCRSVLTSVLVDFCDQKLGMLWSVTCFQGWSNHYPNWSYPSLVFVTVMYMLWTNCHLRTLKFRATKYV